MNGGSAERKESARNILFFLVGIYRQKKRSFGIRNGRKERRMNGDLISRQAAIDALESIGSLDTEADREYARSVFEALPSAQPEEVIPHRNYKYLWDYWSAQPKTGHWICDYKGDHVADYHCSECGRQLGFAFSTQNKKILGGRWKYCDVCGAKMEGETE